MSRAPTQDQRLERSAMIMRLKELKVLIAGWEFPPGHEHYIDHVYIKDIWQKEEKLLAEKKAKSSGIIQVRTRPDPEAVKEVLHWMRKNRKHDREGTREYY